MKHGKVHLVEILKQLPRSITIGAVFDVTQGRVNYAPEEVDDLLILIEATQKGMDLKAAGVQVNRNPLLLLDRNVDVADVVRPIPDLEPFIDMPEHLKAQ